MHYVAYYNRYVMSTMLLSTTPVIVLKNCVNIVNQYVILLST